MSKLEELKQIVADSFKEATEKQEIEQLAKINNAIEAAAKEQDDLIAKNAELVKSYKDLVQHTSFGVDKNTATDEVAPVAISFEEALKEFLKNQK